MKKNIPMTRTGWKNSGQIKALMTQFFNENTGKHNMWFLSRYNENYFKTWPIFILVDMLKNRNISYDIITDDKAYLVYTK